MGLQPEGVHVMLGAFVAALVLHAWQQTKGQLIGHVQYTHHLHLGKKQSSGDARLTSARLLAHTAETLTEGS